MKTKYCFIETPNFNGQKCAPAQTWGNFSTRKAAENSNYVGMSSVYTQKQAKKVVNKWNNEFFSGNYEAK